MSYDKERNPIAQIKLKLKSSSRFLLKGFS